MPARPILCYVTDRLALAPPGELRPLVERIRGAVEQGIDWIQIREKDLSARELLDLAREAVAVSGAAGQPRTRILINGRLDVALAARAGGVHLGGSALPVNAVREYRDASAWGADFLIGASCHGLEAAIAAQAEGADYIFFGPVFSTPSKKNFGPPQGVEPLAEVCGRVHIPVLAIGGVTLENAQACLAAGAAGIAAIRLFQQTRDWRGLAKRVGNKAAKEKA